MCETMAGESVKKGLGSSSTNNASGGASAGSGAHKFSLCVGCGAPIQDQFILRVAPNLEWHAACLKCCECQMFLDENCTCFVRDGKTYCKKDYNRLFGSRCEKCGQSFGKSDYVMRAKSKIFHMECFRCVACEKQLVPGDEFSLRRDELLCKDDSGGDDGSVGDIGANSEFLQGHAQRAGSGLKDSIENNNNINIMQHNTSNSSEENSEAPCDLSDEDMSVIDAGDHKSHGGSLGLHGGNSGGGGHMKKGGDRKSARARTVLSEKQLNILKTCYSANPRPDALMKEQLVEMTGLSPRVIRVWFQNKRCKDKKVQNRLLEKQMQRENDGRKLGYASMHGIPMVASSPVRHESPVSMNPVEIQSYEPPWKALSDFAMHSDLERMNTSGPHFQQIVSQMHGYHPEMPHQGHDGGPPLHHGHPPPPPPPLGPPLQQQIIPSGPGDERMGRFGGEMPQDYQPNGPLSDGDANFLEGQPLSRLGADKQDLPPPMQGRDLPSPGLQCNPDLS